MRVLSSTRELAAVKLPAVADPAIRSGVRADLQELCGAARALSETLA